MNNNLTRECRTLRRSCFSRLPLADRQLTRMVDGVLVACAQPSSLHLVMAWESGNRSPS